MTRDEAKACLTNGGRRTSEAEIDRFLEEVKAGVPVMPVTFVCKFLEKWAEVYGQTPHPAGAKGTRYADEEQENQYRKDIGEKAQYIFLQIRKSNLLARLIYGGEALRTKPCPAHKGRWSGCKMPDEVECNGACMAGSNVTGWLPEEGA